jgi:hypothetical protein
MKAIKIFAAACLLAFSASAQTNTDSTKRYCAKLMDGIVIMSEEGKMVEQEVTLTNGTVIRSDGTITKKDGTKIFLKDGECVDKDGELVKGVGKREGEK